MTITAIEVSIPNFAISAWFYLLVAVLNLS